MIDKEVFLKVASALIATGIYDDQEINLFKQQVQIRQVKKGEVLLKQGEIAKSIYYILNGAFYQSTNNNQESVQIIDLHIDDEWFLSHQSFVTQTFTEVDIVALADSLILEISIESIHFLIANSVSFLQLNKIIAKATSRVYFYDYGLTPYQKYEYIFKNKPRLLQYFSLKMIASYLKISPETLSRVRERFVNKPTFLI